MNTVQQTSIFINRSVNIEGNFAVYLDHRKKNLNAKAVCNKGIQFKGLLKRILNTIQSYIPSQGLELRVKPLNGDTPVCSTLQRQGIHEMLYASKADIGMAPREILVSGQSIDSWIVTDLIFHRMHQYLGEQPEGMQRHRIGKSIRKRRQC